MIWERREFLALAAAPLVAGAPAERLPPECVLPDGSYQNERAIAYAKQYAARDSNSCDKFFNSGAYSDCAHFIAHALAAGGLHIKPRDLLDQKCPDDLTCRNVDLVDGLRALSLTGIHRIRQIPLREAIVGDVGFLIGLTLSSSHGFGLPFRPSHAFMVSRQVTPPFGIPNVSDVRPYVWAHTARRVDELMDSWSSIPREVNAVAFRLENYRLPVMPPGMPSGVRPVVG